MSTASRNTPSSAPPITQDDTLDPTALEAVPAGQRRPAPAQLAAASASYRSILTLAWPTILEQLLFGVIGATDTIVAGHTAWGAHLPATAPAAAELNAAASAAVGTMTYLQWFTGLMTSALGVGATAIVARSIGARRPRVAHRTAGTALSSAFLAGLAIAIALFLFASPIVWACGLHGPAHTLGVKYLHIMSITIALQTAGQIGMACLRGAGDTLRPMLITGSIAALNLLLVPALAFGLPPLLGFPGTRSLGITGNALGTMLAYAIAGLATMILLLSGWAKLRLRKNHFRIVPHILARVLRIGLPSWAEGMLLWLGQFLIVMLIINRNDEALAAHWQTTVDAVSGTTMAAHNAVLRIESFAFLPGFGFGIATSALVGQYLGARRPDQARRAATLANRLAFLTMTLAALPMVFLPAFLLTAIVDSPHVVEVGTIPMIIAGLAQPGFAIAIIMSSGLKGAGETIWPMLSTIAGMFLVRVPLLLLGAWLLARSGHPHLALIAVWIGIFADLSARALFCGLIFRRGHWMHKEV